MNNIKDRNLLGIDYHNFQPLILKVMSPDLIQNDFSNV